MENNIMSALILILIFYFAMRIINSLCGLPNKKKHDFKKLRKKARKGNPEIIKGDMVSYSDLFLNNFSGSFRDFNSKHVFKVTDVLYDLGDDKPPIVIINNSTYLDFFECKKMPQGTEEWH